MGRKRQPLKMRREGLRWVAIFKHPVRGITSRIDLGPASECDGNLRALNRVFMDPAQWHEPDGLPDDIRRQWMGSLDGIGFGPGPSGADPQAFEGDQPLQVNASEVPTLRLELGIAQREIERLNLYLRELEREVKALRGRRFRKGPAPTLREALNVWLGRYQGRDPNHTLNVKWDLERFVRHFGEQTSGDDIEGREADIDAWLRGLRRTERDADGKAIEGALIGAGRRQQVRRHVLRFLDDSEIVVNRKGISAVPAKEVRRDRGAIRWLTREQAQKVAKHLPPYWADAFRIQVALGLRPEELPTLKRADFTPGLDQLTLAPLGAFTLKNGSRTLQVPESIRAIVRARLAEGDIVFPMPSSGKPWHTPQWWSKSFRAALKAAEKPAKIPFKLDCRVGRRTCASLLLRAGTSTEAVASLLGDDPATIREHYSRIHANEVDTNRAALES